MKVVLKKVRIAFSQGLWIPSAMEEGQEKKFSSTFLFAKDHPAVKQLSEAIQQVAAEKWNEKAKGVLTELKAGGKLCLRDGDVKASMEGFAGNMFVSASNRARPTVLDQSKHPLTQQDGKIYSGCYVNVSLDVWPQDHNKYGKRVNASLLAVQFDSDGDAFSGGAAFEDNDFDVIEGGEDGLFD